MPANQRGDCANRVGDYIPGIAGGAHQVRANQFEERGPADDVRSHFEEAWRRIMLTQSKPAMREQQRRKRAWNQERVVEPIVQERRGQMRLEDKSIQRIGRACAQKERIAQIPEPFHSKARIRMPKPIANAAFERRTKPTLNIIIRKQSAELGHPASLC